MLKLQGNGSRRPSDRMSRWGPNPPADQQHRGPDQIAWNQWQNRPRTNLLDPKMHSDEKWQTILTPRANVSETTRPGRKPRQDRMDFFYRRIHLYTFLQDPKISPVNVKQLSQQSRLQFINKILQITHLQLIYWNIFSPQQATEVPPQQVVRKSFSRNQQALRTCSRQSPCKQLFPIRS